jgi:tetratricopeptide (TPR) repeat protein
MNKYLSFGLVPLLALTLLSCSREPKTVDALRSAGQKALLDRNYAKARGFFQKGLAKAPSDKGLLYFTGLCFQREGSYDSALTYLRKADILYPKDRDINQALKPVAELTQSWGYAIGATSVLIATGDDPRLYYHDLAVYSAKNHQPMITMYYQRKVLEQYPDSIMEWVRLGGVALELDSLDVARMLLDTALAKFGRSDHLYGLVGLLRAKEGNYPEAERIFRVLYGKDSSLTTNKLNLANVLSHYPIKAKKLEALDLLRAIPSDEGKEFKVDSLIMIIQKEVDQIK